MDAVVNLLVSYHWNRAADLESADGYNKPVFQYRDWRALVGKVWTTIWLCRTDGHVENMRSVRTEPTVVEPEVKRVIEDVIADQGQAKPVKPKSGKKTL